MSEICLKDNSRQRLLSQNISKEKCSQLKFVVHWDNIWGNIIYFSSKIQRKRSCPNCCPRTTLDKFRNLQIIRKVVQKLSQDNIGQLSSEIEKNMSKPCPKDNISQSNCRRKLSDPVQMTTLANIKLLLLKESCPTLSKDNFCPHFDLLTFTYRKLSHLISTQFLTGFISSQPSITDTRINLALISAVHSVIFSRNSSPPSCWIYLKIQHIYRLFDSLLVYMNIFVIIIMLSTHYGRFSFLLFRKTPFCIVCGMRYCYVLHEAASSYLAESTYPSESAHVKTREKKSLHVGNPITGEHFPPEGECRRLPPATAYNTK